MNYFSNKEIFEFILYFSVLKKKLTMSFLILKLALTPNPKKDINVSFWLLKIGKKL